VPRSKERASFEDMVAGSCGTLIRMMAREKMWVIDIGSAIMAANCFDVNTIEPQVECACQNGLTMDEYWALPNDKRKMLTLEILPEDMR
jgi:hypothetical protein